MRWDYRTKGRGGKVERKSESSKLKVEGRKIQDPGKNAEEPKTHPQRRRVGHPAAGEKAVLVVKAMGPG
jgi:hypothetical protein